MNKKKYYSLTANERKELRAAEQEKLNKKLGLVPATDAVAVAKKHPKQLWILITSITIGVLLIVTAIILPIMLLSNNSKYPVVTFYLSNGSKIDFEVWENSCPISATNFIYLAKIGYFDNTIIYDAQNNFTRFGSITEYGKTAKSKDKMFLDTVTGFGLDDLAKTYKENAVKNMFGYRLKPDYNSTDIARSGQRGVLSYVYKNSGEFLINICPEGETNTSFRSQNDYGNSPIESLDIRAFGQLRDEKSLKVMEDIYALEKNRDPGVNYYVATTPTIKITKTKVSNIDNKKWKNFNFVKFMNTAYNDGAAWSSWSGY